MMCRDSLSKKEKPADHYYVSKKALMNFNKLAEQQFRYSSWLDDDNTLLFLPVSNYHLELLDIRENF